MPETRTLLIAFSALPPIECSPNWRGHWADRYAALAGTKNNRGRAWFTVARIDLHRALHRGCPLPLQAPVEAMVTVYIPAAKWRRMDPDNMATRMKPVWDLLVREGVLIDDDEAHFKPWPPSIVRDAVATQAHMTVNLVAQKVKG